MENVLTHNEESEIRYHVAEFPNENQTDTTPEADLAEVGIKEEELNNREKRAINFLGKLKNLHCLL